VTASRADATPIRFGTSGWRGILGDEITDERLKALVSGVARWLRGMRDAPRVLVGFDGRFASERLARVAASELQRSGVSVVLATRVTPTPALARSVVRRRAAGGLMLTASHNPAHDHGLKVFGPRGESVDSAVIAQVERAAARALVRPARSAAEPGKCVEADFVPGYVRDLVRAVGAPLKGARPVSVFYDAMHGAGAGVLDAALRSVGARVRLFREGADPTFGGGAPDPVPDRLRTLARAVRAGRGLRLGLATDGDADRVAAVDEAGGVLPEEDVAALVVDQLVRSGRLRGAVAMTLASGSLIERVAQSHGLETSRHPIGFRFLAADLESGRAALAVDESGGVAFAPFAKDKDGMLAAVVLAESVAVLGAGLGAQRQALRERHGSSAWGRRAVPSSEKLERAVAKLRESPPARVEGMAVRDVDVRDGVRVALDDGFLMWRVSGTEPCVRIYAEAAGKGRLRSRLRAAERILQRASAARG
jgi:phosphomannomutase